VSDFSSRAAPDRADLRVDYEKTIDLFKLLADIRFKLLALVPSVVGAAIGLTSNSSDPQSTFAVATLGLVATLGILIYELRNSHIYNWTIHRAKYLETKLELPLSVAPAAAGVPPAGVAPAVPLVKNGIVPEKRELQPGGLFTERPSANYRLFRAITVQHDRGLAFVYAAAIAGWAYLLVRSGVSLLGRDAGIADLSTLVAAVGVGVLVWTEVVRHDRKQSKPIIPDSETPKTLPEDGSKRKIDTLSLLQGAAAALLVVAIAALSFSPRTVQTPAGTPGDSLSMVAGAVDRLATAIAARIPDFPGAGVVSPPTLIRDWSRNSTVFGLAMLAIVVGAVLMAFGKGATRAVGAAALAGGLTGTLVRELKLESLVKVTNQLDVKAQIKAQIEAEFGELGTLGPERLLRLERFVPGTVDLESETKDKDAVRVAVGDVCTKWHDHKAGANRSLLVVVGATDRIPLTSSARRRYESNFGLARARAERVKAAIEQACKVPIDNILSLVSGPRSTPEVAAARAPATGSDGYPADRSVEVWAFWALTPRQR
jgi:hypothetical protein